MMDNSSLGSPLQRYAAVNKLMMGKDESMDCRYEAMLQGMKNSSWKSPDVEGGGRSRESHVIKSRDCHGRHRVVV